MSVLKRVTVSINTTAGHKDWTSDVRQGDLGAAPPLDGRGTSTGQIIRVGRVGAGSYRGVWRGALRFDLSAFDWSDVDILRNVYLELDTCQNALDSADGTAGNPSDRNIFDMGGDAKVRLLRITAMEAGNGWADITGGDGKVEDTNETAHFVTSAQLGAPTTSSSGKVDESISPNHDDATRIRMTGIFSAWAPATAGGHTLRWFDPSDGQVKDVGTQQTNHGILLRVPNEGQAYGFYRLEVYSPSATVAARRPRLIVLYEEWQPTPPKPKPIQPVGVVKPQFDLVAVTPPANDNDPVVEAKVQVKNDGTGVTLWDPGYRRRTPEWPQGRSLIANPRQPTLPSGVLLAWRQRDRTEAGIESDWCDWQTFTIDHDSPTLTPVPSGQRPTLEGTTFRALATVPAGASRINGYEVELAERLESDEEPLWRDRLWRGTGLPLVLDDTVEDVEE